MSADSETSSRGTEITAPRLTEFMIRGYSLAEGVAITERWLDLTPEERGRFMFPLPLPVPR